MFHAGLPTHSLVVDLHGLDGAGARPGLVAGPPRLECLHVAGDHDCLAIIAELVFRYRSVLLIQRQLARKVLLQIHL